VLYVCCTCVVLTCVVRVLYVCCTCVVRVLYVCCTCVVRVLYVCCSYVCCTCVVRVLYLHKCALSEGAANTVQRATHIRRGPASPGGQSCPQPHSVRPRPRRPHIGCNRGGSHTTPHGIAQAAGVGLPPPGASLRSGQNARARRPRVCGSGAFYVLVCSPYDVSWE